MSDGPLRIVPCPLELTAEALALALSDLAVDLRGEILRPLARESQASRTPVEGLFVALCGDDLRGAVWGQRQPGRTAILWSSPLESGYDLDMARHLAREVVGAIDSLGVEFSQVLLPDRAAPIIPALEAAGFSYLADLLYLTWETANVVAESSEPLHFESYATSQRDRLMSLIEHTYKGTQDCAAMNGVRSMEDVLEGYAGSGVFRPELWLFVRARESDIGVVLLADHAAAHHWELMYMGVTPEARGRGLGRVIVRHAQKMVANIGVDRIVLAVDAENRPALAMYRDAGFVEWDRRTVFVRSATDKISTSRNAS